MIQVLPVWLGTSLEQKVQFDKDKKAAESDNDDFANMLRVEQEKLSVERK